MKSWNVYRVDGTEVVAVAYEIEYHGEYMGEVYLNVTFNSAKPIDFKIGDYIDYRGERFSLSVVPACKQQATSGSYGQAFAYENVKFNSVINELATCGFLDVVPNDNKMHWTALPTFSFYCNTTKDLADRIQANLDRAYGEGLWSVKVIAPKSEDDEITIDKQTVWDALSLVDTTFHSNFIIRGRTITIGTYGDEVAHVFKYGVGNGLLSLERTVDDSQKVVTRLRAYGNSTNMPTNYYFYQSVKAKVEIEPYAMTGGKKFVPCTQGKYTLKNYVEPCYRTEIGANSQGCVFAEKRELYFGNVGKSSIISGIGSGDDIDYSLGDENGHPYVMLYYQPDDSEDLKSVKCYIYGDGTNFYFEVVEISRETPEFYSWFEKQYGAYEVGEDGVFYIDTNVSFEIDGDNVSVENIKSSHPELLDYDYYPNNMAVTRLMLPGFPKLEPFETDLEYLDEAYKGYKLVGTENDIYIDSPNLSKYGVVEGSLYVDGTDNEYTKEDIYPSIEGLTARDLRNAGFIVDTGGENEGGTHQNDSLDEISYSGCIPISIEATSLDSGNQDYEECASECYVYIKDIGFDINNCMMKGQTPMLHMKSGECVGREFEVARVVYLKNGTDKSKADKYKLTIKRQKDDTLNLLFPNRDQTIKRGDKFVLLNIKPPSVFYEVAKQRLLEEAMKWFVNNDKTRFAYTPTIDNLWIAREHRKKASEGEGDESIYSTIQAGDWMLIEIEDLGIGTSVRISSLTIKENSQSAIPEFDVQLQDKKSVGAIQRIQNKLEDYTNSGGGGLSYDQVKTVISDSGSYRFISKRDDDFAEGQITMEKGLIAQSSHDGKETAADGLIEYYTEEES